ncbi:hypothetical protein CPAST_c11210 [Clostridium pasteurianum DSM 525 = ATCC 6013]|uniref:Xylose isomerase domain-containing protein n=1 Tax=Clostridium pasteurianum DSM 525 = ATCC 6013 TaxID=1262449 RepID=A0A0H3J074_CLOPA|nr:hypothetical protein [Clostridium pasteurianum]AJA47221.1 hypothetical protein CPAST_c11210 [Clostridium pasteurianum DSM 525 = ATCC 6013]AJA51209.1 hypothetical protein CLPA_c11210 [Clostridium pasteurianum DSM 525 = ATCC 6013]ELP59395.1 xylose isomerase domain-containing protein [Clostridium pasteurianum DSM 525 = ATCC 6013]KRU12783.1 xylose isomerase domain-containing protein [Clostridium pasteurianum DSM 525 = ATCC 6013]
MLPYDGNIEWKKIKNQIDNTHYSGAISLEIEQGTHEKYRNMSAEEFLRRAFISASNLT